MGAERLEFALRHLYVYPHLKIAYSYVPKNACTSLKRLFGEAEGWLAPDSPTAHVMRPRWWLSGMARYPLVDERVVVLRDPVDRVLSGYLEKFLRRDDPVAAKALAGGLDGPGDDVTFADLVGYLVRTRDRHLDEHWRPQRDFLLGSYSRVVRFEHLAEDTGFLAERGLVLGRRSRATSTLLADVGTGWGRRGAARLRTLRRRDGVLPSRASMVDDELAGLLRERYAEDVELVARAARGEPLG